ncbi:MAG TPA: HWE histidine kinase domain-containing protein [Tepidisphaeraceae bacterium]|nr:HWE histidine kinase domain-containing protein [Tepidisphaeraceae bacterium]
MPTESQSNTAPTGEAAEALRASEERFRRVVENSPDIRGEQGTLTGGVTVIRDLTERKRAQAALQESERHYRDLAEHNRLLVREVEHRVGNNLAGLLGLVSVMRERATDVQTFADAIESRLHGMASVRVWGTWPSSLSG